jgi:hypothetical protein
MVEPIANQIIGKLKQIDELYYRLLLVIAPAGSGKTSALRDIQKRTSAPLVNINLELSRSMLELTERQRALKLPRLLQEFIKKTKGDLILLDNIEMLFDVALKQDPLRLLQGLSRNKTLVAAWNGSVEGPHMTYATPDHPEYRRYTVKDLLIVYPESTI